MVLQGVKERELLLIFVNNSKSKTIISEKNFMPANYLSAAAGYGRRQVNNAPETDV